MDQNPQTENTTEPRFEVPLPTERYELDFIGEAWNGAFIEFIPFTGYDVDAMENANEKESVGVLYANVERCIEGGKIPSKSGELVDLTKQNFRAIPHKYLLQFYQYAVNGDISANLGK